jgi:Mn2+/Fe2+ NRAMP family transporter
MIMTVVSCACVSLNVCTDLAGVIGQALQQAVVLPPRPWGVCVCVCVCVHVCVCLHVQESVPL